MIALIRRALVRVFVRPLLEFIAAVGAGVFLGSLFVGAVPLGLVRAADWAEGWLELEGCRRGC